MGTFLALVASLILAQVPDGTATSDGFVLVHGATLASPSGSIPVEWDDNPISEMISGSGKSVGKVNGKAIAPIENELPNPLGASSIVVVADLCGDSRDELALLVTEPDKPVRICIVTAITPIATKRVSPMENLDYRLWLARNMGGGCASTFPRP